MIDRLRACMQEGYNSDAHQIFSLLHQINNLFIMQLISPTVQSFNVPISLSFIRDDEDNNSDDPSMWRRFITTASKLMIACVWISEEQKAEYLAISFL